MSKFNKKIKILLNWCQLSKVDINWDKTYVMFVANKRIKIPKSIDFDNINVKIVNRFKLLGVTLDSKLNFLAYSSILKKKRKSQIIQYQTLILSSKSNFKLQNIHHAIFSLLIYFPKKK